MMPTINAGTLKRMLFSEILFSRPVSLDEVIARYDGSVFNVTEYDTAGFLLSANARITKRTLGDKSARDTPFVLYLPAIQMEINEDAYWPFKEMLVKGSFSGTYADVGAAIAHQAFGEDYNNAEYGFVLGDFYFDTKIGATVFESATGPWGVNFAMFYTKQELTHCKNIWSRDIVKIGDIWAAIIPFYLVASYMH